MYMQLMKLFGKSPARSNEGIGVSEIQDGGLQNLIYLYIFKLVDNIRTTFQRR